MSRVIAHHPPADPSTDAPDGIMFTPVRPAMSDDGPGGPTSGTDSGPVGDAKLLPVVLTAPGSDTGAGAGAGTALLGDQFSFLAHLPLAIDLVVEEGHGTKLLPSGELRMDCRATPEAVRDLIATKCLESLELSAKHKVGVIHRRHLSSLPVGVCGYVVGVGFDYCFLFTWLFYSPVIMSLTLLCRCPIVLFVIVVFPMFI